MDKEKELQLVGDSDVMNMNFTQKMLDDAQVLIVSGLLPSQVKTPQQACVIIQKGKELGFKDLQSFDMIDVIMGRATIKPKAKLQLALRTGHLMIKTIEDWVDIKNEKDEVIDKRTTIRFFRKFGSQVIEEDCSFTYQEARQMQYLGKDNWQKQPNIMAWWRCVGRGLDRVAPDLTGGMYTTDEMADVHNVKYNLDAEGNLTILD